MVRPVVALIAVAAGTARRIVGRSISAFGTGAFALENIEPGLGIILVGNRQDSVSYVKMKTRVCMEIGIKTIDIKVKN